MENKMPLNFVLVRMASCAWLRRLEMDLMEILGVVIYFGWRTKTLMMLMTVPLPDGLIIALELSFLASCPAFGCPYSPRL
jgi:hypothetical protein